MKILQIFSSLLILASADDVVDVFGIARCPDTTKFVRNQLVPLLEEFGQLPDGLKIDFHSVPTGGSLVNGSYVNRCLHGPIECALNKLQVCTRKYVKNEPLLVVGCIQGLKVYEEALKCVENHQDVQTCAESEEGEYLLNDENSYRYKVAPTSSWLPWVQINGQRVQDAERHLKTYICQLESAKKSGKC